MKSISNFILTLTIVLATTHSYCQAYPFHHKPSLHPGINMPSTENPEPPKISSPLGAPRRHTTTHSTSTGQAVFLPSTQSFPVEVPAYGSIGMVVFDAYQTFTTPPNMTSENDIQAIADNANRTAPNPGVWFPKPGESLVRYCDWAPGATLELHRTETIDFGVVMQGEMDMILESGESRRLKVGDVLVQRGTLHRWKNPSDTEWARLVFFLIGTEPVVVNGEEKKEVLPWNG
ncbi:oxalate oxidase GF-3.8 [Rhypophila sp. PSN 637]